ncbi:MAG: hypothetical protein ACKVT2_13810 [Saprospiraceae bacterium]
MIDRNEPVLDPTWYNPNCANYDGDSTINGTSFAGNPAGNDKHNYLEYGSETPHQMGWHLVTLATEYELLRLNGQVAEMQRTLEDIFLALQAYRRLDITANCLVRDRYDEITNGFETSACAMQSGFGWDEGICLCMEKYHNAQCKGLIGDSKWHFDIPCKTNCPWTPDLSGYSGFFIREDAVQEQEKLHDPSEDRWNIDLVGGAFAMSQSPPCDSNFSPACYNEKNTNFLSHDQMFSLLMGLAMVKLYIPPYATVTTCNGTVYHPFDIVQKIAEGLLNLPNNPARHIFWPGSPDDDCCYKPIKFGECAGGNLFLSYGGIEYMYNYINEGADDVPVGIDRWKWSKLSDRTFFATAMSIGFDIGDYGSQIAKNRIINACIDDKLEILLLMNDLLHPEEPNLMDDEAREDLKNMFEQMLCDAPCEGVCYKPIGYDNRSDDWPDLDCANTPHWIGQRWEGYGYPPPPDRWDERKPRQYNGLDFMALYNTYMLRFPEERTPYYNPKRPELVNGSLPNEDKIEGPTTLCPGQTRLYSLNPAPTPAPSLTWEGSSNITLSSTTSNPASATAMTPYSPSYIAVSFQDTVQKQQYYNGIAQSTGGYMAYDSITETYTYIPPQNTTIDDQCDFSYRKHIVSEAPNYNIVPDIDPYEWRFYAEASGDLPSGVDYFWQVSDSYTGASMSGIQSAISFGSLITIDDPNASGIITINLLIHTLCGELNKTLEVPYTLCGGGGTHQRQIMISPNPTQNQISVSIIQDQSEDFVTTDPNGVRLRVFPTSGGSTALMDTYLSANGQYINVSSLPNSIYQIRASAADLVPIQANFAIVR